MLFLPPTIFEFLYELLLPPWDLKNFKLLWRVTPDLLGLDIIPFWRRDIPSVSGRTLFLHLREYIYGTKNVTEHRTKHFNATVGTLQYASHGTLFKA